MNPNDDISVSSLLADSTFVNYLNAANTRDMHYWKEWIENNSRYMHVVNEARDTHFALAEIYRVPGENTVTMASEDLSRLKKLMKEEPGAKVGSLRRMIIACSVAASVLLVMVSVWWFNKNEYGAVQYEWYAKADSVITSIDLPDGTTVLLNRNASVAIDEKYNMDNRRILLKGSAFFKVAKDPARPFTVAVQQVTTTALGTAFYVHEDLQTRAVTISLLEGSVAVANSRNTAQLIPGQKAICSNTSPIQKAEFLQEQLQQWTAGKIVLKQADFAEIIGVLRMYYNLNVETTSYPGKMKFTGSFDVNHPEELLESLAFTYGLKYDRRKDQLIIQTK
ncbi:MAG: FecR domain-containing protein [Terrimonas sp.]|nr:FecR domain-containing protein [Terrimonas sp.]OJY85333.1 MAG: hypothetical protein BGP13_22825 [Sphingobacteriales bacterium 40-81]